MSSFYREIYLRTGVQSSLYSILVGLEVRLAKKPKFASNPFVYRGYTHTPSENGGSVTQKSTQQISESSTLSVCCI